LPTSGITEKFKKDTGDVKEKDGGVKMEFDVTIEDVEEVSPKHPEPWCSSKMSRIIW
jgi:hypothetical protein